MFSQVFSQVFSRAVSAGAAPGVRRLRDTRKPRPARAGRGHQVAGGRRGGGGYAFVQSGQTPR
ncbi:hypothetical protein GCM10010389_11450 [Streptomyces echinoruber]|uniref:Uncharacterized protein n=1 Tax=Streptomyces echinoruber TaxID=68898 RepID=A0A918QXE5_9ACTN|nr:hypothetical protein GCM10010389_11450 [Streptomyces echinoruber]